MDEIRKGKGQKPVKGKIMLSKQELDKMKKEIERIMNEYGIRNRIASIPSDRFSGSLAPISLEDLEDNSPNTGRS